MLSLRMQELIIAPDEILYKKGDKDLRIFFVFKGEMESYIDL